MRLVPQNGTGGKTSIQPVLCECTNTKAGEITTKGGKKPVLIMELSTKSDLEIVKFFNCTVKTKGRNIVGVDSDFAKLYRITHGAVERKRFSGEARGLLSRFRLMQFYVSYEPASDRNGKPYNKATEIQPINSVISDDWTATGKLKNQRRKLHLNRAVNLRTIDGQMTVNSRTIDGKLTDEKSLKAQQSLGLEPVFNPIETNTINPYQDKTIEPYTHEAGDCLDWTGNVPDGNDFKSHQPKVIHHQRQPGEGVREYFDRVIESSWQCQAA